MSPLQIRMLLHYSWSPLDYQNEEIPAHAKSTAVGSGLCFLVENGLLSSRYGDLTWAASYDRHEMEDPKLEFPIFMITEKGLAMVRHLCEVSIPVCKWVQPEQKAQP